MEDRNTNSNAAPPMTVAYAQSWVEGFLTHCASGTPQSAAYVKQGGAEALRLFKKIMERKTELASYARGTGEGQ